MFLSLNSNSYALGAHRQLRLVDARLALTFERLASGYRINRAADDVAGLAISERMRSQVRGMQEGIRAAQNGISMTGTADGALGEINDMLLSMRDLAIQAGSDTLTAEERSDIGAELLTLRREIDNVANRTSFNGSSLLKGSHQISTASTIGPLADGADDDTVGVSIDVSRAQADATYSFTVSGGDVTVTNTVTGAAQTLTAADLAGDGSGQTLDFDELGVRLTLTAAQGATGDGTVSGADIAAGLDGASIVTSGAAAASTFRLGGDPSDEITVHFDRDTRTWALGSGGSEDLADLVQDESAVSTVLEADTLLSAVDAAIGQVSSYRTRLGASENQLGHAVSQLEVSVENITAAESRIRNVDIALEVSRSLALQIQHDAIIALLSQTHTLSQSVLSLLDPL